MGFGVKGFGVKGFVGDKMYRIEMRSEEGNEMYRLHRGRVCCTDHH